MSSLVKLKLPPGLSRVGTLYETQGRWYASNLVRWNQGNMQPIGGWAARTNVAMTGKPRAILTWRDNTSVRFIAVGTEQKLYAATPTLTTMVDITPAGFTAGLASASAVAGYGAGLYGAGTYGSSRVDNVSVQDASMWTLDNFGQYLVGCMSDDGKAYEWRLDISTPTGAAAMSGAPTGNLALFVTPENFVVLLGAGGDPRKVQWCDQGDNTVWTPLATNQAGDVNISSQSRLMCGVSTRSVSLIFTELDVYTMQYVGLPYVYTVDRQAENAGIISRGAVAVIDSRAWWMGNAQFFMWDGGSAQVIPCEIYSAVFENMNTTQRSKIVAGVNPRFNEIWWAFPSTGSTENDTIVVYNHLENTWALHSIERTAMTHRNVYTNPIMASSTTGYLYDHETGYAWDGTQPYATSGPAELGAGDRIMRINNLGFDEGTSGDVTVTVYASNWPGLSETTYGPYSSPNLVDCRIAGRMLRQKVIFQTGTGRWGTLRADMMPGSWRF